MPRSSAMLERVDEVDVLLLAGEHAAQRGEREQARVALGDPADVLDLDPVDATARGEAASRPRRPTSGRNGLSASASSGAIAGMLTAVETTPPVSAATICSAVCTPARSCASVVEAPRCGVTTTLRIALEQRVVRDRLATGTRRAPRPRPCPLSSASLSAASSTSSPRAQLITRTPSRHCANASASRKPLRLRRAREVDREEVGLRVDLGGGRGRLGAELAEALRADERVEGDDVHAERLRARRDELADPAEAQHAQRLLIDLHPAEPRPLPPPRRQRRMRLRHVARQRQHQRDRVLRRRHDVRLRRIGHDDPALGRRRHVDVVHADPRPPDHAQPAGALDHVRGDLRRRPDQQAVVVADALGELLAARGRGRRRPRSARAAGRRRSRRSSRRRGHGRVRSARRAGYRRVAVQPPRRRRRRPIGAGFAAREAPDRIGSAAWPRRADGRRRRDVPRRGSRTRPPRRRQDALPADGGGDRASRRGMWGTGIVGFGARPMRLRRRAHGRVARGRVRPAQGQPRAVPDGRLRRPRRGARAARPAQDRARLPVPHAAGRGSTRACCAGWCATRTPRSAPPDARVRPHARDRLRAGALRARPGRLRAAGRRPARARRPVALDRAGAHGAGSRGRRRRALRPDDVEGVDLVCITHPHDDHLDARDARRDRRATCPGARFLRRPPTSARSPPRASRRSGSPASCRASRWSSPACA